MSYSGGVPQFPGDFVFWTVLITLAAFVLLCFLGILLLLANIFKEKKQWPATADQRFPERTPLSLDEFYEHFYGTQQFPRGIVLDVVTRYAAAARVPAAILRPEDSFATLAEHAQPDREACEQFTVETASAVKEAEQRFNANLFSGKLITLDDFVRTTVLAHRLMSGK